MEPSRAAVVRRRFDDMIDGMCSYFYHYSTVQRQLIRASNVIEYKDEVIREKPSGQACIFARP